MKGLLSGFATLAIAALLVPPQASSQLVTCAVAIYSCTSETDGRACNAGNGRQGVCKTVPARSTQLGTCECVPTTPCKSDPSAFLTVAAAPITSFPATVTFTPVSQLTILGLNAAPLNLTVSGSLTASFTKNTHVPNRVDVVVSNLSLSIPAFTLDSGESTGTTTATQLGTSSGAVDQGTGATSAAIYVAASNLLGKFNTDLTQMPGSLNFATGQWTLSTANATSCLRCDINGDGQVDVDDINLIMNLRGTKSVGPADVHDVDGDGKVTVNDARICVLACAKPNCAK
jgi:hypothetical protein